MKGPYHEVKTDVYGEKLLLFYTLILKIVDREKATFKCIGQIHNDLQMIALLTFWS